MSFSNVNSARGAYSTWLTRDAAHDATTVHVHGHTCLFVCLSVRLRFSKTTRRNITKFFTRYSWPCLGSLRRQCDMLCTSGTVDDVMFSYSARNRQNQRRHVWRLLCIYRKDVDFAHVLVVPNVAYCVTVKFNLGPVAIESRDQNDSKLSTDTARGRIARNRTRRELQKTGKRAWNCDAAESNGYCEKNNSCYTVFDQRKPEKENSRRAKT